jgi:hypothetical protein
VAKLLIAGAEHDIRPFKLREIRQAAPFIDRVGARAKAGDATLKSMSEAALDMLATLAVGMDGVSADDLEARMSLADLPAVREAFNAVLAEAGLTSPGEAMPAPASEDPRPAARSRSASTTSSRSLSPPAAETGTA